MEPLQVVGVAMMSGDGVTWHCHPIFAIFVGDYPEQILATGVKTWECLICECPRDELEGEDEYEYLDLGVISDSLGVFDDPVAQVFVWACRDAGIKPIVHPFWEGLPYANIYHSIAPDVLHQLHQGVIKHLLSWLNGAFGEADINAHCWWFPPDLNTQLFTKCVILLSPLSGTEHNQIYWLVLGMVVDLHLPNGMNSSCLIHSIHALLDFLYQSQYPIHSTTTLNLLTNALSHVHKNKAIFVDLGIWDHFNIPKLHFLKHYMDFLKLYGTTNNYSTEFTKHLHIDFAKDAYHTTNQKDEYPQMTMWLDH